MRQDMTVVNAPSGSGGLCQWSRRIGWRVGRHAIPTLGIAQSGAPMCSPSVKNTSWRRMMSTASRICGSTVPRSTASARAWQ